MKSKNYFVGLPIPLSSSSKWMSQVVSGLHPSTRILSPSDLHITVAFLGKMGEDKIDSIREYLEGIPRLMKPINFNLKEGILLPNQFKPTAIALKVDENRDVLGNFIFRHRAYLYEKANAKGGAHDGKIQIPHVTIARPNSAKDADHGDVMARMKMWPKDFSIEDTLLFDEISLFTWSDTYPESPLFEQIHTRHLLAPEVKTALH